MKKIKWILPVIIVFLVLYTRLINISWGLPYPFHPDERNMANAVQGLNCEITNNKFQIINCLNPHFFAYGQLPLYFGYFLIQIVHALSGKAGSAITFTEATLSLRFLSVLASVVNVFILMLVLKLIRKKAFQPWETFVSFLMIIFTPVFIQFAHFGTTESLLMLFVSLLVYCSLLLINKKIKINKFILLTGLVSGLAVATKVSSLIFLSIPVLALIFFLEKKARSLVFIKKFFLYALIFGLETIFFAIIFSPHNLISLKDFLVSMKYESDVGLGNLSVFYTRQFIKTTPVIFQLLKVFPYALGWPIYTFSLFGLLILNWKNKNINFLRLVFLVLFLPNVFFFTKWVRFMAPVFPLMVVMCVLVILDIYGFLLSIFWKKSKIKYQRSKIISQKFCNLICHFAFCILIFSLLIPGVAYLSVYKNPDVRVTASNWIYKNIPKNTYLLSEAANVVDLPLVPVGYSYKAFDFYNLDQSEGLLNELKNNIRQADYIFVPSRRVFMNHSAETYPNLTKYYNLLFSGQLGFKQVVEFSSYPKIEIFGKKILELKDETAEETWTVFDHPVIRIFKKND